MIRPSWLLALLTPFLALPAQAAFTDNNDGTVTDTVTGLMWDKCSWGQSNNTNCSSGSASSQTWAATLGVAISANNASYKGHNDWRLPNKNELESLVDVSRQSPAIDTAAFPNNSVWYWSSTTHAFTPASAWSINLGFNGQTNYFDKSTTRAVRLVRGGQSL